MILLMTDFNDADPTMPELCSDLWGFGTEFFDVLVSALYVIHIKKLQELAQASTHIKSMNQVNLKNARARNF